VKFLSEKMTGFRLVVQPVFLLRIGLVVGGLNSSPIKMAEDSLFFESPLQANSEDHPVRAIGLEFGDRGERVDLGYRSHFGETIVIRARKIILLSSRLIQSEAGLIT
jgi:hypothetical protein